jgi:hypothetical protein
MHLHQSPGRWVRRAARGAEVGRVAHLDAAAAALFSDGETGFGDQYFYTHVRIESGAEQYAWVNRTLFVGQGRVATDGVEYEVYRLA